MILIASPTTSRDTPLSAVKDLIVVWFNIFVPVASAVKLACLPPRVVLSSAPFSLMEGVSRPKTALHTPELFEVPRSVGWREILVAEEDGRPVGVTVLIDAAREETHYWGDGVDPGAWAIDIWIGDAGDRNRGIGTLMMREAVERCFGAHGATSVLIDPLESNVGAIRFYERFGFVHEGPRRFGDDDCLVMRFARRP